MVVNKFHYEIKIYLKNPDLLQKENIENSFGGEKKIGSWFQRPFQERKFTDSPDFLYFPGLLAVLQVSDVPFEETNQQQDSVMKRRYCHLPEVSYSSHATEQNALLITQSHAPLLSPLVVTACLTCTE